MIGGMRTRVAFHRKDVVLDDYGGTTTGFSGTAFLTVWGHLQDQNARERVEGGGLDNPQESLLVVRHSAAIAGVTEADQVRARGREYQIRSIRNLDEKNNRIEMILQRGVAQ